MRSITVMSGILAPVLCATAVSAAPVPDGPGKDSVPAYVGAPATPKAIPGSPVPSNPHMARPGTAAMHADSWASDTYPFLGPLGRNPKVVSTAKAGGLPALCSTVNYAARTHLIVAQCTNVGTFTLRLIDPKTLKDLATFKLPARPSTVTAVTGLDVDAVLTDTSGGAYYYLDDKDRAVLADSNFHVRRFAHVRDGEGWKFKVTDDWNLKKYVPHSCPTWSEPEPKGVCDPVTSVQPDWKGDIWWVTRKGRVGTIDPKTGRVKVVKLKGEQIQNSFAASRDGVSVVSDHALYKFRADAQGRPKAVWRKPYDRGTRRKSGQLDQGSGTTPTILQGGLVAITDNAEPRMNVLVHRMSDGELLCKVPVFKPGKSATDNSLIGFGRSLVVENNSGYRNFIELASGASSHGGLSRIDITDSGCRTVWTSKERSPSTVAKASVPGGLVYAYTKEPRKDGVDAWYLTAIDFHTGKTVFKVLAGTGKLFDNNWAPVTLTPDGAAHVGVVGGLVTVRDS
ncbi:hypothetical protein EDD29_1048 [Actinocorallia herbida]|uniref:Uncharacterized protein n=1 Tax=Actinocorallia herbida TaxID=58109 RepID=A0A3N1CQR7_9ACTN|nr:hypothetical protein EDD29_1048 [Actinocorallia herbida]